MFRRCISFAAIWGLIVSTCFAANGQLPGLGHFGDPYLIEDFEDFQTFADPANQATYWAQGVFTTLMTDIDFDSTLPGRQVYTKSLIAADATPNNSDDMGQAYEGVFDGNGHLLFNITINTDDLPLDCTGVFGQLYGAQISELGIDNIQITTGNTVYTGGFCGYSVGSTISSCYVKGQINSSKESAGLNVVFTGGFCGLMQGGIVMNCYTQVEVISNSRKAGFVGSSVFTQIQHSYAAAQIESIWPTFYSYGFNDGICSSCFYDSQLAPMSAVGSAQPKTTVQMQTESTFITAGWAFTSVLGDYGKWFMPPNDYPKLSWESSLIVSAPSVTYVPKGDDVQFQIMISNMTGPCEWNIDISPKDEVWVTDITPAGGYLTSSEDIAEIQIDLDTTDLPSGKKILNLIMTSDGKSHIVPVYLSILLEGNGTVDQPFLIHNDNDFKTYANSENSSYYWDQNVYCKLTTDLSFENETFDRALIAPDNDETVSGLQGVVFAGHFDGDFHTIRNLTITVPSGQYREYLGIFGQIAPLGRVMNLNIKNLTIVSDVAFAFTGTVAGLNHGILHSIMSQGTISGGQGTFCTGGICGGNENGLINVSSNVTVTAGLNSSYIGGLAGFNNGTIENTCSTASVAAHIYVGGLVGHLGGTISKSYSTSTVTAISEYGPIYGLLEDGTVTDSVWDVEVTGLGSQGDMMSGAVGKTTAQMQSKSTYTNLFWQFVNEPDSGSDASWRMPYIQPGYPILSFQRDIPGDLGSTYGVNLDDLTILSKDWDTAQMPLLINMASHWLAR